MRLFGKVVDLISARNAMRHARKILGTENVYSGDHKNIAPVYTVDQLKVCAAENTQGRHWKLVYVTATSLVQLRERYPHEFADSSLWEKSPWWLRESPQPGYRLLDFHLTPLEKVAERKKNLEKMGIKCSPAKVVTIAQAMIAMKETSTTQYLVRVYHWGEISGRSKTKPIPIIGLDGANGLFIQTIPFFEPSHPIFRQSRLGDEGNIRNMGVVLCVEPPLIKMTS